MGLETFLATLRESKMPSTNNPRFDFSKFKTRISTSTMMDFFVGIQKYVFLNKEYVAFFMLDISKNDFIEN